MLTADPERLAATSIPRHVLQTLRESQIREVMVLGRRGPAEAAFTLPEMIGLAGIEDVDVLVDGGVDEVKVTSAKTEILAAIAERSPRSGRRRIVFRFHTAPERLIGADHVEGLETRRTAVVPSRTIPNGARESIATGLVLRAIGYRARPVLGLPFDDDLALVPNDGGRVEPGVYVAGWIKRGATGFLGTNKSCSKETVDRLLDDLEAGSLGPLPLAEAPRRSRLRRRPPHALGKWPESIQ